FLRHQTEIKAFIGALVRDRAARDDLHQEVALVLWQEFARFDRSRSFGAWARGIAANKVRQRWEKSGRWPLPLTPELIAAVLDGFDRTATDRSPRSEALEECLKSLPEKSHQLVALRYEQALKLEQIAEQIRSSTDAV